MIDAIVTCWSEAMVSARGHQFPPVRACRRRPTRWHRSGQSVSPTWRTTCRGNRRREETMMDFNSSSSLLGSGHRLGRCRDAGCPCPPVRTPVPRRLASRRGCERALQFEYAKAPSTTDATSRADAAHLRARPCDGGLHGRGCGTRFRPAHPQGRRRAVRFLRWPMTACRGISTASSLVAPRALPIRRSGECVPGQQSLARAREKRSWPSPNPSTPRKVAIYQPISNCTSTRRFHGAQRRHDGDLHRTVPFDAALAQRMSDRAVKVIGDRGGRTAAARLPLDPLRMPDVRLARPLLEEKA